MISDRKKDPRLVMSYHVTLVRIFQLRRHDLELPLGPDLQQSEAAVAKTATLVAMRLGVFEPRMAARNTIRLAKHSVRDYLGKLTESPRATASDKL